MATFSASQAATTFPTFGFAGGSGNIGFSYGVIEIAANPAANDIYEYHRVPPCRIVDGFIRADDLDTGTETLDINMGNAANGTDSLDADSLGNFGVWTGDTSVTKPEVQNDLRYNGLLKDGPLALAEETMIQATCVVTAATGGTGTSFAGTYFLEA